MRTVLFLASFAYQGQAPDPAALPRATVTVHEERGELWVELPAIDLPAGTVHEHGAEGGHVHDAAPGDPMAAIMPGYPPPVYLEWPLDASLYGFRVELVDMHGEVVPSELLHHFNLIDPANRELFLPISRRLLAAGKETGEQTLPRFFFGMPVDKGAPAVANAMLHNPTTTSYHGVTTRLVLKYRAPGRFLPIFDGFPFQLDVAFPVGDKSFDLPPGESSKSYDARPSIGGKIVAVSGHVHEYATRIELSEVETGKVLWSAAPIVENEEVVSVPVGKLYGLFKVGATVRPDRTYRVTVTYINPTGDTLPAGGMGVVGGLFVPDRGTVWPTADRSNPLYVQDAVHYMRTETPSAAAATDAHAGHRP